MSRARSLGACTLALAAACHDSTSSVTPPATFDFFVMSSDLAPELKLNQPFTIQFSLPVDLSTVGPRSIRVETGSGVPATGTYAFDMRDADGDGQKEPDPTRIVFQPACPVLPDHSDAGLLVGETYTVRVAAPGDSPFETILSDDGQGLFQTFEASFDTPSSTVPGELFVDPKLGPPLPLIRDTGSLDPVSTYAELGDDPDRRVYFEFDAGTGKIVTNPPGFLSPLNLYAVPEAHVSFALWFDQPIETSEENLARVGVQYLGSDGLFHGLPADVRLVSNCSQGGAGALVRVTPRGIFPAGATVRLFVKSGFRDIVGSPWLQPLSGFAQLETETVDFPTLVPADVLGDEVYEPFDHGAPVDGSLQDPNAVTGGVPALWGEGVLRPSLGFEGTGGPGGDFDWFVRSGQVVFFDTTSTILVGGPGGVPTTELFVTDGELSVRNVVIEAGAQVRVQGPNPLNIDATGSIQIHGTIDISGFAGRDVATLNTGHIPEPGGAGVAGGGDGGTSSEETTTSTSRGGSGHGPFGVGIGGMGGESAFAPKALGKDARRPGGGGGGRFAADEDLLVAQTGFPGHPQGRGAESGLSPARGGEPNRSIFVDGNPDNDFYGAGPRMNVLGELVGVIEGELERPWAGHGGGAGGDAVPSDGFPTPNWNPGSDEKGGPGGGAAGLLRIRALGPIVFGVTGEILAMGGRGGVGENTLFLDHVGGSGGSASGGHVILESASYVELEAFAGSDMMDASGGPTVRGPLADVPPNISHGGSGGPGLLQIHVPRPERGVGASPDEAGIVLPELVLLDPDPLGFVTSPRAKVLFPTFGHRSVARSRWIPLGAAAQGSSGTPELVSFLFAGTETAPGPDEGKVRTNGVDVLPGDALFGPGTIDGADARLGSDDLTLILSGSALAFGTSGTLFDDVYLRTPELLENFTLKLSTDSGFRQEFPVARASFEPFGPALELTVAFNGTTLRDFVELAGEPVDYELVRTFFRVRSRLGDDRIPEGTYVRILFQGATRDTEGEPAEEHPVVDWTGDISAFNALPPGALDFFRFEVEFGLDPTDPDPEAAGIELDLLRIPFRF